MAQSFLRMELSFLFCLFHVQFMGALGKLQYNTLPEKPVVRSTPHVPLIASKVCLLKPDGGPCRGNIEMYHFDPALKNCSTFRWGGCQGNGNRFDTESDCLHSCLTAPNLRAASPRYCSLSFDYGFCFGALNRWYFDKFWKVCKKALYSGCGGNKNNFYSFEQCDAICRLSKSPFTTSTSKDGIKKILVVNPQNATDKRGQDQVVTKRLRIYGN